MQLFKEMSVSGALLGVLALIAAYTTFRSASISSFLKIFVGIFSTEAIIFGLAVVAARAGIWPNYFTQELPPNRCPPSRSSQYWSTQCRGWAL